MQNIVEVFAQVIFEELLRWKIYKTTHLAAIAVGL